MGEQANLVPGNGLQEIHASGGVPFGPVPLQCQRRHFPVHGFGEMACPVVAKFDPAAGIGNAGEQTGQCLIFPCERINRQFLFTGACESACRYALDQFAAVTDA